MTVTDISEISKTKVKVCIDYETYFALYKSEIKKYAVNENEEISQGTYDILINDVLLKRAKIRCMNLLKSRDYTKYQLEIKLKQGMYPQEVIDAAVAYVASYGYIDDVKYAGVYLKYASQTKSRKQIENDLQRKGVPKDKIEKAFVLCMEEDSLDNEQERIIKILEKKGFDRQNATFEERRKMVGFLYRKGFELDDIYDVMGQNDK
ncbi:MAG: recombination regulator RecX [Lachnospiraceae bacterium]|nr:recombination regulator RecX [Lachnospiraceae bacterium]